MRHTGKVVLITGAASGIGRACAQRFHAEGARVAVTDIDLEGARAVAASLGEGAIALHLDVTDEASVDGGVAAVVEQLGRLDCMINNAGVARFINLLDTSLETWRETFAANVEGVFLGCRAAARQMIAQGDGGSIVNASSGAARRGIGGLTHYCASKAAVVMLSQSLAHELAPHRIRVNCYQPGHTDTGIWTGLSRDLGQSIEAVKESLIPTIPLGRLGRPEEIAGVASWLCSDEAAHVTGASIAVNGGDYMT